MGMWALTNFQQGVSSHAHTHTCTYTYSARENPTYVAEVCRIVWASTAAAAAERVNSQHDGNLAVIGFGSGFGFGFRLGIGVGMFVAKAA